MFVLRHKTLKKIAGDEQMVSFKGKFAEKLCTNFNKKTYGFQSDNIVDYDYTLCFYLCNNYASADFLKEGPYPLHIHIISLVDCIGYERHCVGMGNLYNSVKFLRLSSSIQKSTHACCEKKIRSR